MKRAIIILTSLLTLAACAGSDSDSASDTGEKAEPEPADTLYDPFAANLTAPDEFTVRFDTTKGSFIVQVLREWSPSGADRLYNLVKMGYLKDIAFFRVVPGFIVQFGIHGDPQINRVWNNATIPDDPVKQSNKRGYLTFAKTGAPNSRSVQFFINYKDNGFLDEQHFSPVGQVTSGMEIVDSIYSGYGERPNQGLLQSQGNDYLKREFPSLDYIESASIVDM